MKNLTEKVSKTIEVARKAQTGKGTEKVTIYSYYADGVKPQQYDQDGDPKVEYLEKSFTTDEFKKLSKVYLPESTPEHLSGIEIAVSPYDDFNEGFLVGDEDRYGTLDSADIETYEKAFKEFQKLL